MKCKKCGKEIANDSRFCEFCGARVGKPRSWTFLWIVLTLCVVGLFVGGVAYYENELDYYRGIQMVEAEDTMGAYVDLGLPSGTLWATCNIGASSPEDYGDYFAWGETEGYNSGKSTFNWSTYKWCNGSYDTQTKYNTSSSYGTVDNKTELDLEDDAAYVNWGSNWRMPSKAQFDELINSSYTTTEWTSVNGVNGWLITSKTNGNSIFLPAAGCRYDTLLNYAGSYGYYWSRTLNTSYPYGARYLYFDSSGIDTNDLYRYYGQSVRPVRLSE